MFSTRIGELGRTLCCRFLSIGLARSGPWSQPEAEAAACREFSIVVAVHDAPVVVKRCLDSLARYARSCEVILVDDGSSDPTTRELLRDHAARHRWHLVTHARAMGHSRACEAGARLATRPFLCLLNSDTYVTPWGWAAIRDAFVGDDRVAIVGPATSWAVTEQRVASAALCRHFWNDSQIVAFAERYLRGIRPPVLVDVAEVSGCAFFIRRAVWLEFGGFDAALDDYGNESFLCVRVREAGRRLVWAKASYVHHFGQQSYSQLGHGYIARRRREYRRFLARRTAAP